MNEQEVFDALKYRIEANQYGAHSFNSAPESYACRREHQWQ